MKYYKIKILIDKKDQERANLVLEKLKIHGY